jgi:ABC-type multidrug transport system fused ATPase/permease subunit
VTGYQREHDTKSKSLSAPLRRNFMSLISLVGILIVIGVALWLINTYIPMDSKIKSILNAVIVIAVILWLLQVFGIIGSIGSLNNIRVGK